MSDRRGCYKLHLFRTESERPSYLPEHFCPGDRTNPFRIVRQFAAANRNCCSKLRASESEADDCNCLTSCTKRSTISTRTVEAVHPENHGSQGCNCCILGCPSQPKHDPNLSEIYEMATHRARVPQIPCSSLLQLKSCPF